MPCKISTRASGGLPTMLALWLFLVASLLLLAGCQAIQPSALAPQQTDERNVEQPASGATSAANLFAATEPIRALPAATALPIVAPFDANASVPTSPEEESVAALVAGKLTPVRLVIADARMDLPIAPMGWQTTRVNGVRSTSWVLPKGVAGWHVDSARPGESGNLLLSGRQLDGDVFAPIAQNAVHVGQEMVLIDSAGNEYRYRITEISPPLALQGDIAAEEQASAYLAQTDHATLTLVTGWPDFTTTHRIFVVGTLES
jgi:hypothetical protein